ncbi:hypothetical protein [Oligoflexus sp.]|uniref:alpha/beta hydrolase family protein n=1 Tax=Oligoflexus sp. TaxID=1971216 RepID=UPI002D7666B1|nr:hypothetical protein [Oligoflexus sp.]
MDKSHLGRDLLAVGPFQFDESLYSVAPGVDRDVLPAPPVGKPEVKTDIRGKLYLPRGEGPFPLLLFLHGNHGTCGKVVGPSDPRLDVSSEFTLTGTCPEGMIESPSFLGYEYSARHLASWGYAVISVNANLGITARNGYDSTDGGLVYARGALVLKHLISFYQWSGSGSSAGLANKGLVIKDKLDFSEVGFMGHSRGGEGVRYAYNIYEQAPDDSVWKRSLPGLKIKGIFEIAPVDFGTQAGAMKVEANGTAWSVLLGGCDRDVSLFSGGDPYARMLTGNDGFPKSVFTIWGANHNFFNSEWQVSDAPNSCYGNQRPLWNTAAEPLGGELGKQAPNALKGVKGSEAQQTFARALMFSFFRANVGKQPDLTLLHTFDPQYALPTILDQLAHTSREFVRLKDSLLVAQPGKNVGSTTTTANLIKQSLADKVSADLSLLQLYWNAYATEFDFSRLEVNASAFFPRQALILESPPLASEQTVDIPFTQTIDSEPYWTVDASLSRRTSCYKFPASDCVLDTSVSDVEVAVLDSTGAVSKYVQLSDYIKLENYHSQYFELAGQEAIPDASRSFKLYFNYIPLIFSTARFELTDFDLQDRRIKGLRFKFPAGKAVDLAIDEVRLVKR